MDGKSRNGTKRRRTKRRKQTHTDGSPTCSPPPTRLSGQAIELGINQGKREKRVAAEGRDLPPNQMNRNRRSELRILLRKAEYQRKRTEHRRIHRSLRASATRRSQPREGLAESTTPRDTQLKNSLTVDLRPSRKQRAKLRMNSAELLLDNALF